MSRTAAVHTHHEFIALPFSYGSVSILVQARQERGCRVWRLCCRKGIYLISLFKFPIFFPFQISKFFRNVDDVQLRKEHSRPSAVAVSIAACHAAALRSQGERKGPSRNEGAPHSLVRQLNEPDSDESFWNPRFHQQIAIFYNFSNQMADSSPADICRLFNRLGCTACAWKCGLRKKADARTFPEALLALLMWCAAVSSISANHQSLAGKRR